LLRHSPHTKKEADSFYSDDVAETIAKPIAKISIKNKNLVPIMGSGPITHGQGYIGQRLSAHRSDNAVMAYQSSGTYYASWITPPADYLDGIERYLSEKLKPLVGDAFPVAAPIEVNLP
jgi:hypothetical protein